MFRDCLLNIKWQSSYESMQNDDNIHISFILRGRNFIESNKGFILFVVIYKTMRPIASINGRRTRDMHLRDPCSLIAVEQ